MESSYDFFTTCTTYEMVYWYPLYPHPLLYTSFFPNWCQNFSMLIIQWTDCMTIVTFRRWLENVTARCWNTHLVIFHWNDVNISRYYVQKTLSHTTTWNIINFLISRTFKIKDFKGHYLKLVVLQDYTQFAFTNIVYFNKNIFEVQEHITNWSSQLPHICDLQNQGFWRSLLQTSGTSR